MPYHSQDDGYFRVSRPFWVMLQEEAHKVLSHGKLCPWCKNTVLWTCNMRLVHRLGVPRKKDQVYPSWVYFDKLAWDWVCGETCEHEMAMAWSKSQIKRPALANKILAKGPDPAIRQKKRESYRESVLRLARIGYDDGRPIVNPALRPFYIEALEAR